MKRTGDYYGPNGKSGGLLNSDKTEGRTWNFLDFDLMKNL